MIDPPSYEPDTAERKVDLEQTVDYTIQLLVEEAHLVGWTRAEFLTAVMDAANARLSAIERSAIWEALEYPSVRMMLAMARARP